MGDNIIVKAASTLGSAVGAFSRARDQRLKKPEFVEGLAQSSQWSGGNMLDTEWAHRRAARNSWFYTGINIKALDLIASKYDIFLNVSGIEGEGEKVPQHPYLKIMRRPNPYMGEGLLWQYTHWWMDLRGEAYWFLNPEPGGISEIWPLPAGSMDMEFTPDFKKIKQYILKVSGKWYYINPDYVCHFKYANPFDFFRGMSPLLTAMLSIDIDQAMKVWNGAFFGKDNTMPSAIISLGSGDSNKMLDPKDVENVKRDLQSEYQAIKRKTVVTNANNMAVSMLGWNAKDMDFLAGMEWNKDEILNILGVPPGVLDKNSTEANATVGKAVLKDNMWGLKNLYADEISTQIMKKWYNESLELRFEDDRITDRKAELEEARIAEDVMTEDEIREKYFGLEPLKEGEMPLKRQRAADIAAQRQQFGQDSGQDSGQNPGQKSGQKQDFSKTDNPDEMNPDKKPKVVKSLENEIEEEKPDVLEELGAFHRKALNAARYNKNLAVKFVSEVINEETVKAIQSDLQGAETKSDIDEIFSHWEWILKGGPGIGNLESISQGVWGNDTIRDSKKALGDFSWRPWSGFEFALIPKILDALREQFRLFVEAAQKSSLSDPALWQQSYEILRKAFEDPLVDLAHKAAQDAVKELVELQPEFKVSWDMTNLGARDWALKYAATEIKNVEETTQRAVRKAIAEWIDEGRGEGIAGLQKRLEALTDETGTPLFGEDRAKRIARSETTSVYAGAKSQALEANGYRKAVFLPRAHVNCRCYIQPAIKEDGTKIIVWYTARDEFVCDQKIKTPWGIVDGCAALHRVIVSEGFAGQRWEGNKWNPPENNSVEEAYP